MWCEIHLSHIRYVCHTCRIKWEITIKYYILYTCNWKGYLLFFITIYSCNNLNWLIFVSFWDCHRKKGGYVCVKETVDFHMSDSSCCSWLYLSHCYLILYFVSRYLINLECAGDPAWECLVNQQKWLTTILLRCKEQHFQEGTCIFFAILFIG